MAAVMKVSCSLTIHTNCNIINGSKKNLVLYSLLIYSIVYSGRVKYGKCNEYHVLFSFLVYSKNN